MILDDLERSLQWTAQLPLCFLCNSWASCLVSYTEKILVDNKWKNPGYWQKYPETQTTPKNLDLVEKPSWFDTTKEVKSRLFAMNLVHFWCLYSFSGWERADSVDELWERRARTHVTRCCFPPTAVIWRRPEILDIYSMSLTPTHGQTFDRHSIHTPHTVISNTSPSPGCLNIYKKA